MEWVAIVMAIIKAIQECREDQKPAEIVDGLLAPGRLEKFVVRREVRRSGVTGRRNRRAASHQLFAKLNAASRSRVEELVVVASKSKSKQRAFATALADEFGED